ncbi:sugar transferase [Microvirga sp. 2TAF3]|uniref:sugar transferase n=1 Tax=Microvirga sp. 2TAF3 TaxID=3233014 RepID=UPI003F9B35FE
MVGSRASEVSNPAFSRKLNTSADLRVNIFASKQSLIPIASQLIKRSLDVIAAFFLLVLATPLMLVIAALVAIDGGAAFYRHERIGAKGLPFSCIKFRTMILDAERCLDEYLSYHPQARDEWRREQKLAFDPRVTAIGRILRLSSLDELPQLINVIKGDMSLVGPRPITSLETPHYGLAISLYKSVRPGITGLWQISGRNDVGYEQRVRLDEYYVANRSLLLDLWILLRTPAAVLSRRGAR